MIIMKNLLLPGSLILLFNLAPSIRPIFPQFLFGFNFNNNNVGSISSGSHSNQPPIGSLVEANNDAKRLYEDLMMSYNRFVRPVGNDSDTLILKMGLKLSQLIDVNLRYQMMTTIVWVEQEWTDYKLKWDPDEYGGITKLHVPADDIWLPDLVLYNNADGNYEVTILTKAILHNDGRVIWKPPAVYKSSCHIDVSYFPFDQQTCILKFGTWTWTGNQVDLRHIKQPDANSSNAIDIGIDLSEFLLSVEWDVMAVPATRKEKSYVCCAGAFTDITFNITLRRKTLFYTVNLIIPCIAMSLLSILVFYLPSDSNEKVSLSISIVVSVDVFLLCLIEIIPPTSFTVPLLGQYLLFTLFLVTLSVIATVFVLNISFRTSSTHKMSRFERLLYLKILPVISFMKKGENDKIEEMKSTKLITCEICQRGRRRASCPRASRAAAAAAAAATKANILCRPTNTTTTHKRFNQMESHNLIYGAGGHNLQQSYSDDDGGGFDDDEGYHEAGFYSGETGKSLVGQPYRGQHHCQNQSCQHQRRHFVNNNNNNYDDGDGRPGDHNDNYECHEDNRDNQDMIMMMGGAGAGAGAGAGEGAAFSRPPINRSSSSLMRRDLYNIDNFGQRLRQPPHHCSSRSVNYQMNGANSRKITPKKQRESNRPDLELDVDTIEPECECDKEGPQEEDISLCGLQREVANAFLSLDFVSKRMENRENYNKVEEDWRYVATMIDRFLLIVFSSVCVIGTAFIVLQAPAFYDSSEPIDVKLSKMGPKIRPNMFKV